jgi:hypothetical protein
MAKKKKLQKEMETVRPTVAMQKPMIWPKIQFRETIIF